MGLGIKIEAASRIEKDVASSLVISLARVVSPFR